MEWNKWPRNDENKILNDTFLEDTHQSDKLKRTCLNQHIIVRLYVKKICFSKHKNTYRMYLGAFSTTILFF